jgi:glutamate synthase (NADPH/NADH) small chain
MPTQDPGERAKNFDEVALGYSREQALMEAERCLKCKRPLCVKGCPVDVPIPDFISLVAEEKFTEAAACIKAKNSLPAVCGRVCPQESQCEAQCVLGKKFKPVAIGRLERFVADWEKVAGSQPPARVKSTGKKVAIVGAGPAGLTCAGDLARLGYDVTIFEALHKPGGVLIYGIPEFRLPKSIIGSEVAYVQSLGVRIDYNVVVGRSITIDELMNEEGFQAVFLGPGAGAPVFMNIPGENLKGVYSANEFLTRINLMKAYRFPHYDTPIGFGRNVAVVGGGNVAMDASRSALRLGAEKVHIVYRRSMDELPARQEEVHHAQEEGIMFDILCNPLRIIGDENGWVKSMECIRMELGEPDASGRRRPVPREGSEFEIELDTVIMSLGTKSNPILSQTTPDLKVNKWGYIVTDEKTGATSKPGVYAGGDIVTGAATVIQAMGAGKCAARAMHDHIQSKSSQKVIV